MNENLPTLETLDTSPFKKLVLSFGAVPTDFKESMTYYELLSWLCNYVEKEIIPVVNHHSEEFNTLINAYNQLKDYVDNYFKNLDVQEEINNKLDEMAESGQLAEIIAIFLQSNGVLAYNTIADMSGSTTLISGSFAYCYGKLSYNDGDGSFYKIRNVTSGDNVDGYNIVAISYDNTIIGERIPNGDINELKTLTSNLNTRTSNLETRVNALDDITIPTILVGDSYGQDEGEWCDLFTQMAHNRGEDTTKYHTWAQGGASAVKRNSSYPTYKEIMQSHINDLTSNEKSEIKRIILCAGHNDEFDTVSGNITGLKNFFDYCMENFPNASIYFGMIGWDANEDTNGATLRNRMIDTSLPAWKRVAEFGGIYLSGVEYLTHVYETGYWKSDGYHPQGDLNKIIATGIFNAVYGGSGDIYMTTVISNSETSNNIAVFASGDNVFILCNDKVWNVDNLSLTGTTGSLLLETSPSKLMRYCNSFNQVQIPVSIDAYNGSHHEFQGFLYYVHGQWRINVNKVSGSISNITGISAIRVNGGGKIPRLMV